MLIVLVLFIVAVIVLIDRIYFLERYALILIHSNACSWMCGEQITIMFVVCSFFMLLNAGVRGREREMLPNAKFVLKFYLYSSSNNFTNFNTKHRDGTVCVWFNCCMLPFSIHNGFVQSSNILSNLTLPCEVFFAGWADSWLSVSRTTIDYFRGQRRLKVDCKKQLRKVVELI